MKYKETCSCGAVLEIETSDQFQLSLATSNFSTKHNKCLTQVKPYVHPLIGKWVNIEFKSKTKLYDAEIIDISSASLTVSITGNIELFALSDIERLCTVE